MHKIYKILLLIVIAITTKTIATAQVTHDSVPPVKKDSVGAVPIQRDTVPTSVNVELENIFNAKAPKEYIISDIKVTGSTSFDPNLIISISGLAVGDKVVLPGGDNFARAINNLWKQNLVSNVEIFLTQLTGKNLSVEINITDRPSLTSFKFKGISKGESDELTPKLGLAKGRTTRD